MANPAPVRAAVDLSLIWAQILFGFALYIVFPHWLTFAIAFLLIAGGQHGLVMATHEFGHFGVVPSSRKLNDLIGLWFFASPIGLPLKLYRDRHFEHHRHYSTERDTKSLYRKEVRGWRLFTLVFSILSGWGYISHILRTLIWQSGEKAKKKKPSLGRAETLVRERTKSLR